MDIAMQRVLSVDVDTWGGDVRARFFELIRAGDEATLRRFVTGLVDVDADRGEPIRVRFDVTLTELVQPWGIEDLG